jgi:hypothetical protein
MRAAAEDGLDIALVAAEGLSLVHIPPDSGKALKIFLDIGRGLLARDRQLVGEAEGGDAVNDAEINRLGAAAHVGRHALDRHAEHFRRGHRMDVHPVGKGLAQLRNVGDMGQHAQLDLRIVR